MALLSPTPRQQYYADGSPASGYKLYTYENGTTTPKTTYKDSAKAASHTNPIILDAAGYVPDGLFLDGDYTFALKDASEVEIWSVDDIESVSASSLNVARQFLTVSAMTNSLDVLEGDVVETIEFASGAGGGGMYEVVATTSVTPNTRDIIQGVANTAISFVLIKGRDWNANQFGAGSANTNSENKAIIDSMIQDIDAAGGGVIYIPYNVNYGFKLATPSTFLDLSSLTNGDVVIKDDSQVNNESSGRVGAQTRTFFGTVPTTPPGQHNGNGFQIFGKWHPFYMVTTYETEETGGLSPYRASFITRAINDTADAISADGAVELWGMGQRNVTSSNSTFADRTGYRLWTSNWIYDVGGAAWLNTSGAAYSVDRYSGCQSWGGAVDRTVGYNFILGDGIHSRIFQILGETSDEEPEFKLAALGSSNSYRLRPDATNADYQLSVAGTVRTSYDINGNVHIGDRILSTSLSEVAISGLSEGNEFFRFIGEGFNASARYFAVTDAGSNGNAAAIRVGTNSSTGRSINAGGTINASGADYAEYENNNGIEFRKGDIVGFDSNGKLTNKFSKSIRFGIKSTDPAYVGGDTWDCAIGEEPEEPLFSPPNGISKDEESKLRLEWESTKLATYKKEILEWTTKLEEARLKVDRVAYSGKVPVNVNYGDPGDYIVVEQGVDDTIKGVAIKEPMFDQYKKSVGRVNRRLSDGRLEVAVIVH